MLERIKEYYGKSNNQEAVETIKALQEKFGEPNIEHESIPQFTHEDAEKLIKRGFHIYTLTGKKYEEVAPQSRKEWLKNFESENYNSFSKQSEVAILTEPREMFLRRSNKKTYVEQLKMLSEYSKNLRSEWGIKHVKAIMGNISDYCELSLLHKKQTDKELFKFGRFTYIFARTRTPGQFEKPRRVVIGQSGLGSTEICDSGFGNEDSNKYTYVFPIVVPIK